MDRRRFLAALGSAPLLARASVYAEGSLPPTPGSSPPGNRCVPPTLTRDIWRDNFAQVAPAYASQTWVPSLPRGLRGTLYRNGPALMKLGNLAYRHWFDGDGMVHAFQFGDNRLTHRARLVRTSKLVAEQQAGKRLYPGYGTSIPDADAVQPPDMNVANINTLPMGDGILALWEGGEPYVLDPVALETLGKKTWSPRTENLPFSAHPKVDRDGTVWSFGYMPGSGMLALYQIRQGQLTLFGMVQAPNADMVHDFAITERYLVFVLMPYRYIPYPQPGLSFTGHYQWQTGEPGYVLVVDKATLAVIHQIECPPIALMHLGNAWEVGNTLRLGVVQYRDINEFMRRTGSVFETSNQPFPASQWLDLTVDLAARKVRTAPLLPYTVEFPRYDNRRIGQETRIAYMLTSTRPASCPVFGFNAVQAVDLRTGNLLRYDYGPNCLAEEHIFVPRPGATAENDGWLIGTAYDWTTKRTRVSVFHAARLDHGPIMQTVLPYGLPLGIHGNFVAG